MDCPQHTSCYLFLASRYTGRRHDRTIHLLERLALRLKIPPMDVGAIDFRMGCRINIQVIA